MTHSERLRELVATAEGGENYIRWLENPITQAFIGALREHGRPTRPDVIATEAAYLSLGESLGWNAAADLLENPAGARPQVREELVASYGAALPPNV